MFSLEEIQYILPDNRELFAHVNLRMAAGDAVAITGPSGIGKSTLLGIVGGLIPPTAGRVSTTALRRDCAWILQSVDALSARSVLANSMLLVTLDGRDVVAGCTRAMALLEETGLSRHIHERARTLSGGELQRLAAVRVLASGRRLVLADEPTTQLDRRNAQIVMDMLFRTVTEEGRTLVVVTHDVESLPSGCRVLILKEAGLGSHP